MSSIKKNFLAFTFKLFAVSFFFLFQSAYSQCQKPEPLNDQEIKSLSLSSKYEYDSRKYRKCLVEKIRKENDNKKPDEHKINELVFELENFDK